MTILASQKKRQIVTRDTIRTMLRNPNARYVEVVIGRALVALMQRQTDDEVRANDTRVNNGVGFTGADARSGTITAKTFMRDNKLLDWQIGSWKKIAKSGYPRLAKYHKQLNEIALEKI
jgi:hypothetical protein